jgi:dTDP-4-dehydrorhamnose 3,5-epimerase
MSSGEGAGDPGLMTSDDVLPDGVQIRSLKPHPDDRGVLTEIFRQEWTVGCDPVQWNVVHSAAAVLRGVHVHVNHSDYLVMIAGVMVLGMHDIRPESRSRGWSRMVTLEAAEPRAIIIPPGVCHGFHFPVPSTLVYAVSAYWNPRDELGCRFDCPELGLQWPNQAPRLSDRDRDAGSYAQMCAAFRDRQDELRARAAL